MKTIAIAGNPNCGKSALFNVLTGIRQTTGNWPGVTVERKQGTFLLNKTEKVTLVDLPGIYSLDALSLDEQVTRNYLLEREADAVINVIDASNLERNLYLTVQLLEMGVPIVIALNMMDIAHKRGIRIDTELLQEKLGCPIVPIIAINQSGIPELKQSLLDVSNHVVDSGFRLAKDAVIEQSIAAIKQILPASVPLKNQSWIALKLLEGDKQVCDKNLSAELENSVQQQRNHVEQLTGEPADLFIADARYGLAHSVASLCVTQQGKVKKHLTDRIDKFVLHRWFGVPLFLFIMYLMFMFTINFGGAFIDFFDMTAKALFVDSVAQWLNSWSAPQWLVLLLSQGVGSGLQVVATFIPIIACLYLFLSVLEDSGYMARAAFVMDRFMRAVGLPGKAFVPMIVGFGCNVPAVMATRTLENERERKLTILMNPFMSCGARLPVYVLFAAAFFPTHGHDLVFVLYLTGILVAILTGLIMKRSLLRGQASGFIMELPTYHIPTLRGVLLRTWDRVSLFIRDAGKVIIVMVMALNMLNAVGTDGSFNTQNSQNSVLSYIGKTLTPMFYPLGISDENWQATVGIFTGVLAKEAVVGSLNSLYASEQNRISGGPGEARETESLLTTLQLAMATVPENLSGIFDLITDPLGIGAVDEISHAETAQQLEIDQGIFGAMVHSFDGQAGAFAYLLFILLYFPCAATIGAIVREAGRAWAIFVAFWSTSLAYLSAGMFYQGSRLFQHPVQSGIVLFSLFIYASIIIMGLLVYSRREHSQIEAKA